MLTTGKPPELTGDAERDVERLRAWCEMLYAQLVRMNNYHGSDAKVVTLPGGEA